MNNLEQYSNDNNVQVAKASVPSIFESIDIKKLDNLDGQWIINEYLNSLNSDITRKSFKKSIQDFFEHCYGDRVITLRDMKINDMVAMNYANYWKNKIRKDVDKKNDGMISMSTYNSKVKGIKYFYKWLLLATRINDKEFQYVKYNPFESVKLLGETDSVGSMALTPDEVLLMLNNPYGKTQHQKERNLLIFELTLITGLRESTILNLKESEIKDIDSKVIIEKYTKGHKVTAKPITNYYERLIKWYKYDVRNRAVDNGTIFNLNPITANKMIKNWVKSVGIEKKVTFHGLRATSAIMIFHDTGEDKYRVQKFLNHSTEVITQRYLDKEHYIDDCGINALENLKNQGSIKESTKDLSKEDLLNVINTLGISQEVINSIIKGA